MIIAVEYDVGWDSRMTVLVGEMCGHGMVWYVMVWDGGKPE